MNIPCIIDRRKKRVSYTIGMCTRTRSRIQVCRYKVELFTVIVFSALYYFIVTPHRHRGTSYTRSLLKKKQTHFVMGKVKRCSVCSCKNKKSKVETGRLDHNGFYIHILSTLRTTTFCTLYVSWKFSVRIKKPEPDIFLCYFIPNYNCTSSLLYMFLGKKLYSPIREQT